MRRIHDRGIQARLDCVIEEDAVEDRPRVLLEAKRDIAHPQDRQHARQLSLDAFNRIQRLDRRRLQILLACGNGESQGVENQGVR